MSGGTVSRPAPSSTAMAGTAMAGTAAAGAGAAEGIARWAALDKMNERLVEPTHPLLLELRRAREGGDADLAAAS
jgi:hypothetical protein